MQSRSHITTVLGRRRGFTLIEVLTVIAIIGILIGLLLPAIGAVRARISKAAMVMEVKAIATSVQQYKTKYGDFPPDGSNAAVLTRHLRKAFPNIAASEISLLTNVPAGSGVFPGTSNRLFNYTNGAPDGVMDPAEALVFFLGGFSDDPVYPISGEGGPVFITDAAGVRQDSSLAPASRDAIQYNPTRNNPIHDFGDGSLALDVITLGSGQYTLSTDETMLFSGGVTDLIPTYSLSRFQAPIVYFDSRTYAYNTPSGRYFNHYQPTAGIVNGVARPYKKNDINTTVTWSPSLPENQDMHFPYVGEKAFQLICAGLDEDFGGVPQTGPAPIFYRYPSGEALDITDSSGGSGFSRYKEQAGQPSAQLDNVTDFADGVLEDALDQ